MNAISIESLKESFLLEAASLMIAAFNTPGWDHGWTHATAQQKIREVLGTPGNSALVAFRNDELLGVLLGTRKTFGPRVEFFIEDLFISPHCQKQGIGTLLLNHLEQMLAKEGIEDIYLDTIPQLTQKFYEKNGYRISEKYRFMIKGVDE